MKPCHETPSIQIFNGDCLEVLQTLPDQSVNCCVTSPPYWGLRDYGVEGQLGLERTPEEYVEKMVVVFEEVRRVLRDDGTLWLNMGDSYAGSGKGFGSDHGKAVYDDTQIRKTDWGVVGLKPKDLVGVPWMLAFALRGAGWYLRSDIIWAKTNPMPESVTDRPTKAHEYIFLLSKSEKYYYDQELILEPVSPNTHMRLSQDLAAQIGSHRANGGAKTNGPMKAVSRKACGKNSRIFQDRDPNHSSDRKQDQTGNRRYTGFNERWEVKQNESFDAAVCLPVQERNKRTVWSVGTQCFSEAHFATFPEELILPCILAGCPAGGTVLDPFFGSGTTGLVAQTNGCKAIGIELNPEYIEIAKRRLAQDVFAYA